MAALLIGIRLSTLMPPQPNRHRIIIQTDGTSKRTRRNRSRELNLSCIDWLRQDDNLSGFFARSNRGQVNEYVTQLADHISSTSGQVYEPQKIKRHFVEMRKKANMQSTNTSRLVDQARWMATRPFWIRQRPSAHYTKNGVNWSHWVEAALFLLIVVKALLD
jgi:hypothetical protein